MWKVLASFAICTLLITACADGYDSPNGFDVGVNNTDLVTPDSLTFKVAADGKTAKISWPLVLGAESYEVTMLDVTNPDSAVVVDDYLAKHVDGCSMTATVSEDSKYTFQIKVIGDTKRGNRDGSEVDTVFATLVPSIATIPDGSDIYQYLDSVGLDSVGGEVAIDLEPGGHYKLSGPVDFQYFNMTFRGNKKQPSFIEVTDSGAFYTYSGLKFKYLRIDMTQAQKESFLYMSNKNLPDTILSEKLGYMRSGSLIKGIYNILDPIYFQDVWIKNQPQALVHDNSVTCAWWTLTITDCIMQMNNSSANGFICFQKKGDLIKNVTIKNSTIYNIVDNKNAYFLRWWNASNSSPEKVYGNTSSELKSWYFTMSHVTLSKCFTGQKWVNNVNGTGFFVSFDHCIFYDLYQPFRRVLEKGVSNSSMKFNFFCNPDDETDVDYKKQDSSGSPCASLNDPQFAGDILQELDLTKPNAGIDFTPTNSVVVDNFGGDSRWLGTQPEE